MTNPEQRGRVLRKSEEAKVRAQDTTPPDVPKSAHDEKLEQVDEKIAVQQQTTAVGEEATLEKGGAQPAAQQTKAVEKLELPKGAMIAMRKSGGIKFSSHEVVVYPDGRVTYEGGDTSKSIYERPARKLTDAQVMKMRRMLEQTNFFRMKSPEGRQSPDEMAYEIVARVGTKHNQVEMVTGNMPDSLMPLIEQLNRLMPSEE